MSWTELALLIAAVALPLLLAAFLVERSVSRRRRLRNRLR